MILAIIIVALIGWIVNIVRNKIGSRETMSRGYASILAIALFYSNHFYIGMLIIVIMLAMDVHHWYEALNYLLEDMHHWDD